MVILDTSIIIDYMRQTADIETPLEKVWKQVGANNTAISVLTIQELYQGKSSRYKKAITAINDFLKYTAILDYTAETAALAGRITRDTGNVEFVDAAIAATGMINEGEIATLNTKHFEKVPYVKLYDL